MHNTMNYKLILASGSPRRRELLSEAGLEFTVRVSEAEEIYHASKPAEIVQELSEIKALAVAREILKESAEIISPEPCIILGADTVVSADGRILGKPADPEEAAEMIRAIQGRAHEVYTGVCLILLLPCGREEPGLRTSEIRGFSEGTCVHVVPLSEQEIQNYVACGESLDKAGAYAIQGEFGKYIDRFEGDYENVIGLPVKRVLKELCDMAERNA